MLGDDFFRDMVMTFKAMRAQAKQSDTRQPYLFDNYNVINLTPLRHSNIRAFLARVLNELIKELNKPPYQLPRYIIVILDKDLIANADLYDYGVSRTIEDTLKWLLININQAIETRKEDIMGKRPGGISTTSEPRLVWVNMLHRPHHSMNKRVFSLARKFNDLLEGVIHGNKKSHILKVEIDHNTIYYDRIGQLTQMGKIQYWKKLDEIMKEFDRGRTELEPTSSKYTVEHCHSHSTHNSKACQAHHNTASHSIHRNHPWKRGQCNWTSRSHVSRH